MCSTVKERLAFLEALPTLFPFLFPCEKQKGEARGEFQFTVEKGNIWNCWQVFSK